MNARLSFITTWHHLEENFPSRLLGIVQKIYCSNFRRLQPDKKRHSLKSEQHRHGTIRSFSLIVVDYGANQSPSSFRSTIFEWNDDFDFFSDTQAAFDDQLFSLDYNDKTSLNDNDEFNDADGNDAAQWSPTNKETYKESTASHPPTKVIGIFAMSVDRVLQEKLVISLSIYLLLLHLLLYYSYIV